MQRQNTGLCLQPLVKWFGYAGFYLILGFISPLQRLFIVRITALFRLEPTLSLMSVPIINEVALPLYNKKRALHSREVLGLKDSPLFRLKWVRPSDCRFVHQVSHSCSARILGGQTLASWPLICSSLRGSVISCIINKLYYGSFCPLLSSWFVYAWEVIFYLIVFRFTYRA